MVQRRHAVGDVEGGVRERQALAVGLHAEERARRRLVEGAAARGRSWGRRGCRCRRRCTPPRSRAARPSTWRRRPRARAGPGGARRAAGRTSARSPSTCGRPTRGRGRGRAARRRPRRRARTSPAPAPSRPSPRPRALSPRRRGRSRRAAVGCPSTTSYERSAARAQERPLSGERPVTRRAAQQPEAGRRCAPSRPARNASSCRSSSSICACRSSIRRSAAALNERWSYASGSTYQRIALRSTALTGVPIPPRRPGRSRSPRSAETGQRRSASARAASRSSASPAAAGIGAGAPHLLA